MTAQFKTKNPKLTYGYTLIEILVALTIVGLLFSFGFVSFRDFSRRQALKGLASLIKGDLRLAQSSATSGQKPDSILCNSPETLDGYYFRVISESEYSIEANCTGGNYVIKNHDIPEGITVSTPNPNPILFKILGTGTNIGSSQNAVLTLIQSGTDSSLDITITSGGEIK